MENKYAYDNVTIVKIILTITVIVVVSFIGVFLKLYSFMVGFLIYFVLGGSYWLYVLGLKKEKEDDLKRIEDEKEQQNLINKFNDNAPIFIRVPRGFVSTNIVISKENGWSLVDDRFVSKNEHFSTKEVLKFQEKD